MVGQVGRIVQRGGKGGGEGSVELRLGGRKKLQSWQYTRHDRAKASSTQMSARRSGKWGEKGSKGLQCMAGQAANCQLQQRLELPPTCCDCKRGNSPCHCPCCSSLPASVSLSLLASTLPAPCLPHSPWQRETASHCAAFPTFLSVSLPAFLSGCFPTFLPVTLCLPFSLFLCLSLSLSATLSLPRSSPSFPLSFTSLPPLPPSLLPLHFFSFLFSAFHFNYFSNAADAVGNDIKFTYAISLLPQDLPIVVLFPVSLTCTHTPPSYYPR